MGSGHSSNRERTMSAAGRMSGKRTKFGSFYRGRRRHTTKPQSPPSEKPTAEQFLARYIRRVPGLHFQDLVHLLIPFSDINLKVNDGKRHKIGAGGSGQVFRGRYFRQDVAVKQLYSQLINEEDIGEILKEASIMEKLRHPGIVRFYGISFDTDCNEIYIITEFCQGCVARLLETRERSNSLANEESVERKILTKSLRLSKDYISTQPRSRSASETSIMSASDPFNRLYVLSIAMDVSDTLRFLHARDIVHRDLKPGNLLMDAQHRVKLCDFGLAKRIVNLRESFTKNIGTPAYMAPELFDSTKGRHIDRRKCDVYSFGILLYALLSRKRPFYKEDPFKIIKKVAVEKYRPPVPDCPIELGKLMQECWAHDPDTRPSFVEIYERLDLLSRSIGLGPHDSTSQVGLNSGEFSSSDYSFQEDFTDELSKSQETDLKRKVRDRLSKRICHLDAKKWRKRSGKRLGMRFSQNSMSPSLSSQKTTRAAAASMERRRRSGDSKNSFISTLASKKVSGGSRQSLDRLSNASLGRPLSLLKLQHASIDFDTKSFTSTGICTKSFDSLSRGPMEKAPPPPPSSSPPALPPKPRPPPKILGDNTENLYK
eukprot:g1281.t1